MTTLISDTTTAEEFDLQIPTGRIHARRVGPRDARLVLLLPGLSANLRGFDYLVERLAGDDLQLVAVDLRGRGLSETTGFGTYGWVNHAVDVFAIADALGADTFDIVGQSMGGAVAMCCAQIDARRVRSITLLDICGRPDLTSLGPLSAAIQRLGAVYPSVEAVTGMMRAAGVITPWSEYWDRYFEYDLVPTEGGVTTRTSREAVFEDSAFAAGAFAFGDGAGIYRLWEHLAMPVLLLRSSREMLPGTGHIVPAAERDRFLRSVPTARAVDIDGNHYTIATSDATVAAIAGLLRPGVASA